MMLFLHFFKFFTIINSLFFYAYSFLQNFKIISLKNCSTSNFNRF